MHNLPTAVCGEKRTEIQNDCLLKQSLKRTIGKKICKSTQFVKSFVKFVHLMYSLDLQICIQMYGKVATKMQKLLLCCHFTLSL